MIQRSNGKYTDRPSYKNVTVCDEWVILSNFIPWFNDNYVKGYALDKDIFIPNNNIYSPDTCIFVPQDLNNLLTKKNEKCYSINDSGNFKVRISIF